MQLVKVCRCRLQCRFDFGMHFRGHTTSNVSVFKFSIYTLLLKNLLHSVRCPPGVQAALGKQLLSIFRLRF